jgi:hypothetical protein
MTIDRRPKKAKTPPIELPGRGQPTIKAPASALAFSPDSLEKCRPDLCLVPTMKTIAGTENRTKNDFYTATLAPVDQHGKLRIRPMDVMMLTVLFLELGVLVRFLLAK